MGVLTAQIFSPTFINLTFRFLPVVIYGNLNFKKSEISKHPAEHPVFVIFTGRQDLGGPPTKAMLLWLGSYICLYLYFYVSSQGSDVVFTVFGLAPSATALSKRSTRAQINILNYLPPLLALCVLKHLFVYEINYIDRGKNNHK